MTKKNIFTWVSYWWNQLVLLMWWKENRKRIECVQKLLRIHWTVVGIPLEGSETLKPIALIKVNND